MRLREKVLGMPLWAWGAVAGLGGIGFFWYRSRKNAAAAAAAAAAGQSGTGTMPAGGYAAANYGAPDNNLSALGDLLNALSATQGPASTLPSSAPMQPTSSPTTPTPIPPPANVSPLSSEVVMGPGYSLGGGAGPGGAYGSGIVQGNDGQYYSTVSTLQAAQQLFAAGHPVYVQPAIGQFVPITSQAQFDQAFTKGGATTWVLNPNPNVQTAA